jgi:hypothetical protein
MNTSTDEEQTVREHLERFGNMAPPFRGLPSTSHTSTARRHLVPTLAAASVAVLALGAVGIAGMQLGEPDRTPPVAEPGDPSPSDIASSDQAALARADRLRKVADRIALSNDAGYGKTALDLDAGTLTVFWHGEPPQWVQNIAANPGEGITVEIVQAGYSEDQLLAAARLIFRSSGDLGVQVVQVSMMEDLSGVTVSVTEETIRPGLADEIARIADIPVEVITGEVGAEQPHFE